jgi:hypothetical protein
VSNLINGTIVNIVLPSCGFFSLGVLFLVLILVCDITDEITNQIAKFGISQIIRLIAGTVLIDV